MATVYVGTKYHLRGMAEEEKERQHKIAAAAAAAAAKDNKT
jgi:hypothetical protein